LKERDIVLIQTDASAYNTEQRYLTDHCGMTAEATRYLIARGVRLMDIDPLRSIRPWGPCLRGSTSGRPTWSCVMMITGTWRI
jgi:kynurenine formamidase